MPESPLIKPAATAVLLKQTDQGLRILMLKRNSKLAFAGGFWVFPGGGVEEADYNDDDIINAAKNAVIRETKEEAGLTLNDTELVYFAHWTTPNIAPKRYATWFFMAGLQEERSIIIDNEEIHDYAWVDAKQMLQKHQNKEIELLPPTYITLHELSSFSATDQALDFFCKRQPPIFVPKVCLHNKSVVFLYEGDSGYATGNVNLDEKKHRFYMGDYANAYHCNLENFS